MADVKIKVSQLSAILDKNIDDKDLFLVSDRNNNEFFSRQMTMGQLRQYISKKTIASNEFKTEVKNLAKTTHLLDTKENWEKDPLARTILLKGQIAFVKDTELNEFYVKVGDGISAFGMLPYVKFPQVGPSQILVKTTAEWQSAEWRSYVPPVGQIVVWSDKAKLHAYSYDGEEVQDEEELYVPGIKIGNGKVPNIDMQFVGEDIDRKLQQHLSDILAHVSDADRKSWNHKITVGDDQTEDGVIGETLKITRN